MWLVLRARALNEQEPHCWPTIHLLRLPDCIAATTIFKYYHLSSNQQLQVQLTSRLSSGFLPLDIANSAGRHKHTRRLAMFPATSPIATLSRSRLKALSIWVRDELDQLVAREGPNILRPDDVLILHETFIALYHATEITALDLRATGIHRAVQDISGVATRWPSRLCDDCDKIITLWTTKFGALNDLHPFLYGRGGRLEGIASATEYTREVGGVRVRIISSDMACRHFSNDGQKIVLISCIPKCPTDWATSASGLESRSPEDSHSKAAADLTSWWINTLFAHHAGIIGLEAVEGGTTFDKHGAYALVLKDTGEVEACHGDAFTYRCPQWDRGKFRLTAATPRSRDPIRVLRSHSINSVWGPKAGVRYEGL